jgi:predicted negative regulator of RcsB-dependent stress response
MRNIITVRLLAAVPLACAVLFCRGQVTLPRIPSPAATLSQTIGISSVTVNYSRPSVNGREIWGKLVPFGWNVQGFGAGNSAPWRAGANENTVLKLSHPAMIEGHLVPAGSYGLFFVINADNTGEVVLSKDYRSWGSFFYDPKQDEMRAKISLRTIPMTERLTYDFQDVTKNSGVMVLNWEKMQFPVKIEFAVDDIVMANAAEELKSVAGFTWMGWSSAANYALQNKVNYDQALTWIETAIAINANFTDLQVKSGLLKAQGKDADAENALKAAVDVATEVELNNYGYQLLAGSDQEKEKAIGIFVLNTQRHPTSANCFDSLGEAYALKGNKKDAIVNFKKSLSMNPPAATRANSEKYLKQLGAM